MQKNARSEKWTPGPWRVSDAGRRHRRRDHHRVYREISSTNSAFWIAEVQAFDDGAIDKEPAEFAANANLIAAAPELYEALRDLRDEVRDLGRRIKRDSDALADLGMACDKADSALSKARGEA